MFSRKGNETPKNPELLTQKEAQILNYLVDIFPNGAFVMEISSHMLYGNSNITLRSSGYAGSLYADLARLEAKDYVRFEMVDFPEGKSGKRGKYFAVTKFFGKEVDDILRDNRNTQAKPGSVIPEGYKV
jgi:predicted transcriptional regulator with HTH domain